MPGRKSPFSSDSQIYAEHLLERFRLFFLIALGETVLTLGNAFASEPVQADRLLVLACLALLVLALATAPLSLLAAVIASTAVLVGVAMADSQAKPESASPQMAAP